ncbi:MAG: sugar-binding protein, partial [Gemmatimonadota bacterium]
MDGRAHDGAWQAAQVIEGFRVFDPVENGDPTMKTEARVAFDENNVYVLVRAYDPEPSKIMALLSRRDERTQSDWIRVVIDSYHDKRSGFQFMVNPAGVKRDILLYNDGNEDIGWDAVWDVKTSIDSLGWLAEFRIPLNQLRYAKKDSHTFGFGIHREVARLNERSAWPLFSRSRSGIASQLGELHGIQGIATPRRLEVLPYMVTANESEERSNGWGRDNRITAGADIKYGLTSNLTLD